METALTENPRTGRRDEARGVDPTQDQHQAAPAPSGHDDEIPTVDSLPKPRRWMLVGGALVVLIVLVVAFVAGVLPHMHRSAEFEAQAAAVTNELPSVSVQYPAQSKATSDLKLPGSMQALQETALYARTGGYLKNWTADFGAQVKAGELLATIDAPEVDSQLDQAKAQLASDEANASKADLELMYVSTTTQRFEALIKSNGVTPQELDMYHANTAKARTALLQAKASVVADEANVKRLQDMQSFEKIIAPFAGTVTARNFDIGALITANGTAGVMPLFRLAETDVLRVWVNVPQEYAPAVKPGQTAKLAVRQYPGKTFEGKVMHTAGALDTATRTLPTEVQVPNPDGKLFAGMFCDVEFTVTNPAPPLIIPISALISDAQGNQVAIVDGEGVAHYRAVTLGRDYGTTVEVLTGLEKTDRVITNP
ncbi:MAG TPA: efflux RND transporter periplasmic adaptor subunit, partial [Tepidisphaeraceae bacterium]